MQETESNPNVVAGAQPVRWTTSIPLYRFQDLEGRAQEKARERLIEIAHDYGCLENWEASCLTQLKENGFEVNKDRRNAPSFFYELSSSQSHGLAFHGRIDAAKAFAWMKRPDLAQRLSVPGDPEKQLAIRRFRIDMAHAYRGEMQMQFTADYYEGRSSGESAADDLVDDCIEAGILDAAEDHLALKASIQAAIAEAESEFEDFAGSVASQFYSDGEKELEWLAADAQLIDMADANGYAFSDEGVMG